MGLLTSSATSPAGSPDDIRSDVPELDTALTRIPRIPLTDRLTSYARGRLVKDRASKELKLNCRNWECGILFPVPPTLRSYTPTQGSSNHRKMGMDVFEGHVPVPMLAGQEYGGRRPWFYLEE